MQFGADTSRGDTQQSALRVLSDMRATLDNPRLKEPARREKLHELTDQLETLARALLEATVPTETWAPYKLSCLQARLGVVLHGKLGYAVTTDTIMDALYFDRNPDEVPDRKIVQVTACNMRKKLAKHNAPFRIETVWGVGLRLVRVS